MFIQGNGGALKVRDRDFGDKTSEWLSLGLETCVDEYQWPFKGTSKTLRAAAETPAALVKNPINLGWWHYSSTYSRIPSIP